MARAATTETTVRRLLLLLVLVGGPVLYLSRRREERREQVHLYYDDGSMVTLERGAPEEIKTRLRVYLPILERANVTQDVLDIGVIIGGPWLIKDEIDHAAPIGIGEKRTLDFRAFGLEPGPVGDALRKPHAAQMAAIAFGIEFAPWRRGPGMSGDIDEAARQQADCQSQT